MKQASPDFAAIRRLAMRFRAIFRSRDVLKLMHRTPASWACGVSHGHYDATSMPSETQSSSPWSNGQTEGQINRLKTLKRAMYGRAGAELLRARMLPIHVLDHHTN
ncbi:hypothetical protein RFM23_24370 [Mesorhizobium abyssinicae]|uniref:Transposase n=1 Tax=Mesorhizobium abyssinicae TaxID=1209958 RepID=A0ABU5ATW6_9HYPH|nr:hypothetical protein [Mesorhizobium abyssinicae]MDX8540755.1 hypothetical protein [Mesorhizobium abyssinicae]